MRSWRARWYRGRVDSKVGVGSTEAGGSTARGHGDQVDEVGAVWPVEVPHVHGPDNAGRGPVQALIPPALPHQVVLWGPGSVCAVLCAASAGVATAALHYASATVTRTGSGAAAAALPLLHGDQGITMSLSRAAAAL